MSDEGFMSLAISLAKRKKGLTHPNPTVGCVIVNGGQIVGLGYHERAGYPHAEIVALEQAGERAKGSTLYVTLEPCTHFGRTPPCTDAIIESGVKRVVIATSDPNPVVSGKGIEKLRKAGIDVTCGVLEREAKLLNEDFFTYITKKRPYVTLKLAQTVDGKIATTAGDSKWITSKESRRFAHRLRAEASAVLVGINTVLQDNPALTVRHIPFPKNPLRVVIDPELDTPLEANIAQTTDAPTLIVFSKRNRKKEEELIERGVQLLFMEEIRLSELLEELHRREIVHLLVEGGAYTLTRFIKENLWDRLFIFQAPKLMGKGLSLEDMGINSMEDVVRLKLRKEFRLGEDRAFEFIPQDSEGSLKW